MNLKHLTPAEYDQAHATALQRVIDRNGDKPTLQQFKQQQPIERGLVLLYGLATVIFIVAFFVSSQHVISYANKTAALAHIPQSATGLTALVRASWFWIHELGLLLLAETAMITFMIMARVTTSKLERALMVILSLASALFVVWANLQSGLVWHLALLVPSITLGASLVVDHWAVNSIQQERACRANYQTALTAYNTAVNNPSQHGDFPAYLRQAVFDALMHAQTGNGATARRAWLQGLTVPERAWLSDVEIGLNDWDATPTAPAVPTAVPTATGLVIHEGIDVIHANGHANGNGNGHHNRGKVTRNGG